MPLETIDRTFKNVNKSFKKLLPILSRSLPLNQLTTKNVIVYSMNDKTFNKFNEDWEDFLHQLDKFWNQLNAYAKHHAEDSKKEKLIGFLGNINATRTTDDLLVYLDKARNNSQHTLWRHLRESRPFEVISGHGSQITFHNDRIEVTGEGDATKQIYVFFRPGLFLLNRVKVVENKKDVYYELPINHLNRPLEPMERVLPQYVGKLCLEYYSCVLINFKNRIK